ncbi:bifunctional pyr operon transcriptional regulator/uracil phosphoribosyltransferase PyrR [Thermosulfurimonas dismutans]|uniref:Bifunctional protein PyrR n=1 Tax=Thermosulfurimonas dismutans TaxID=999894 RepID=A0A179D7T9_9BACT|nr:bifunctional pyr operon transcriptional regulator/uracil phosphoribosyltransferase PyrR [Thermosulfurimonas dismutans]OAQ21512.1 Phosphoribosyl transferase [Thermosulfurimonas dismutans]
MKERLLAGAEEIERTLTRLTHEIIEKNRGCQNLILVGIRTGGVPIARRIQKKIAEIEGIKLPVGTLDISLYRDDWSRISFHPEVKSTEIPVPIDDMVVILVDDVIFTGRTARAALDALMDFGRPRRVELAVLVDRGHRELPIEPNYVGFRIPTHPEEHVNVRLKELEGQDLIVLETP